MSEVKIANIVKQFGDSKAVDNFNIVIKDGQFVSLLGPSGCGKTTMLRMIAGFEKPTSGEIYIGNKLMSSNKQKVFIPPEKRNLGMVFQSYAVWPHMNVFDNVAYPLKIKKMKKDVIKEKVDNILQIVHLSQYADRYPNQLSGGQQQRIALGRALVAEPDLLLLDEPLSNLDAKLRESMRFEIKDIQKKLNMTVVYVTHDQAEAMAMSDVIIVINHGVIQQIDKPINVYSNPVNQFVANFIGKVNFIKGESNGEDVKVPAIDYNFKQKNDVNGKAVVAIRPENISLSKSGEGIHGKLKRLSYLGEELDLRVDINGVDIRITESADKYDDLKVGDDVFLTLNKKYVFEDTGADDTRITT